MFITYKHDTCARVCVVVRRVQRWARRRSALVIDVGGLNGEFGLQSAQRGCHTTIFEPQRAFAERS